MQTHRIGIFGASGYAGMELTRLAATHAGLKVTFLASERYVGTSVGDFVGVSGAVGRMSYLSFDAALAAAAECEAVLLATPPEVSGHLATALLERGLRVVDLSGAFRLASPKHEA